MCFSFMLAGHDTCLLSSSQQLSRTYALYPEIKIHSLATILAFLASDSHHQDKLVSQVQEVTQGRDGGTLVSTILSSAF